MRLLHKLRLSESDAMAIDFAYRACQVIENRRLQDEAENALHRIVRGILGARFKGREEEVPGGWKWSYAGRTLYVSAP
jgi:hypothetical protein